MVIMTCCGSDRPPVVQRDVAAVRHDAVDERELARLERERA